jgi:hypothetical protein
MSSKKIKLVENNNNLDINKYNFNLQQLNQYEQSKIREYDKKLE